MFSLSSAPRTLGLVLRRSEDNVPFRLTYLMLGLIECLGAGFVYLLRRDLRRAVLKAGLIGGFVEVVSEVWYLHDYWQPLTILPVPAPEDFIYGFGVTALAASVVPLLFHQTYEQIPDTSERWVVVPLFAFAVMMLVGQVIGQPSIWTATASFMGIGFGSAIVKRRELFWAGAFGGLIMGLMSLTGYAIGLNLVIDGQAFLDQVLIRAGGPLDIRIAGNVPFDEIAWNIARGWCVAILYPFLTAQRLAPLHQVNA